MHVAINAQLLSFSRSHRSGGISRYIYHLLQGLAGLRTPHRFTAFVPDLPASTDGWEQAQLRLRSSIWPTDRPATRIVWEQVILPRILRRSGAELLHATGYVSPLLWRGPSVVTVCDLSFIRFPRLFNRANRTYLRLFTPISVKRAARVLTISEHTRQDVIRLLGAAPDRVSVTYCGVDERFRPIDPDGVAEYRRRRGLPEHFILYLGTLEPRKNVATLLRAYARLRAKNAIAHHLVLAGAPGWQYQGVFDTLSSLGIGEYVHIPGFVDESEQTLCYNAADLFVYPSLYEGFGLPVLEAMACGVPVVSSNAASLPEVVGDAGILVEPLDEPMLAEAIVQVLSDASLRDRMRLAGLEHAERFSWASMAHKTLEHYERAFAQASAAAQ